MGEVVRLRRKAARPIVSATRRIMPGTNWKRRRWVVILAHPNGETEWWPTADQERARKLALEVAAKAGAVVVNQAD